MPTYDYRCESTGQVVEASHRMSEQPRTWGELCALSGLAPGDVPADSPVTRLATGGNVVGGESLRNPEPACGTGACCPAGYCGSS